MSIYKTLYKLVAVACLGFYAVSGYSLALSDAQVKSYLNQQLDVRIRLVTSDISELDDLKISLSRSKTQGGSSYYHLKYEVLKSGEGNFLRITTHDVVREPIIEFTLDIGWSDGHVVREYSFLIDPPRN
jgi:pilus assembly protein FimV